MKPFPWAYGASILVHVLVLLFGGLWLVREAEYDVESGETSVEVELVEATPEPPPPTPVPTPEPTPTPPPQPSEVPVEATPAPTPTPTPKPPLATATPRPTAKPAPPRKTRPVQPTAGSSGARGSTKPQYLSNPAPEYPEESRAAGEHGSVMLRVEVDAKGRPASVEIARSSGFRALDNAAVRAVKRWKFRPATVGGIPVATTINVPVQFQLH